MGTYKRGNNYWIRFTTPRGRRIRESARTTSLIEAKEYEAGRRLEEWRIDQLGEARRRTWREAVVQFKAERSHLKSWPTIRTHLRALDPYLGTRYLDEITRDLLDAAASDMRSEFVMVKRKDGMHPVRPLSATTINRRMEVARSVMKAAAREWNWITEAPAVRMLPTNNKRIRWLTRAEADRLIAELPQHLQAMVRFSLATGLRESNVTGLKWSEIDLQRKCAWVHHDEVKNEKALAVPLNAEAIDVLKGQLGRHLVNVFTYKGRPVKNAGTPAFKKACNRGGIKEFRWHDLRHTWASWHVQAGTPLHVLQELGGWSDVRMVQRYAHLSPGHLSEHVERIGGTNLAQSTEQKERRQG